MEAQGLPDSDDVLDDGADEAGRQERQRGEREVRKSRRAIRRFSRSDAGQQREETERE
jgi:hypothetical protein